jgi:hypothetical protein
MLLLLLAAAWLAGSTAAAAGLRATAVPLQAAVALTRPAHLCCCRCYSRRQLLVRVGPTHLLLLLDAAGWRSCCSCRCCCEAGPALG